MKERFDLAIIGGGPAGYVGAIRAAQLGGSVVLIEKDKLGGTCLNVGCIPTKALITSAEVYKECQKATEFGVYVENAKAHFAKMVRRKDQIVSELRAGVEYLIRNNKVTLKRGIGRLKSKGEIEVIYSASDEVEDVRADKIMIATGSETAFLPVPGIDLAGVITSTEALELEAVPQDIVIIGGGVIGIEFGSLFATLGSKVTIIEMMPTILPGFDQEITKRLKAMLVRTGVSIHTRAKLREIVEEREGGSKEVLFGDGEKTYEVESEIVLVATGRKPFTKELGLEVVGIEMKDGAILVDEYLKTSVDGIFAAGDVIGGHMLAHVAFEEGKVAVENALSQRKKMDYKSVPKCVFSSPEVASVGLSEEEAKEKGMSVKVSKFPFSANPRAVTMGETTGVVKIISERNTGRIVGFHIIGPRAADLIAEGALAVQIGVTADELGRTIHAHPTLPEAVMEAALGYSNQTIHFGQAKVGERS